MIGTLIKRFLASALSVLLVIGTTPLEIAAQQAGYSGEGVPLSSDELQQLVAPIALYPDSLVAQVLGAASFPDQVSFAANWLQQNSSLTGQPLMYAVNEQQWDPSVKAMTQFPSVLDNMAKNLSWTSALGEAYTTQGPEVMSAVQVLRAKAQAAGNLTSGLTDQGRAGIAASHRDSSRESASSLCPRVQPSGGLWLSLRDSGIQYCRGSGNRRGCVRGWNRGWGDDERRVLRMGLQQLELWLAWHNHGGLPRRRVLRKHCLARGCVRSERRRPLWRWL